MAYFYLFHFLSQGIVILKAVGLKNLYCHPEVASPFASGKWARSPLSCSAPSLSSRAAGEGSQHQSPILLLFRITLFFGNFERFDLQQQPLVKYSLYRR